MSRQLTTDLIGVLKGLRMILTESIRIQEEYVNHKYKSSSIRSCIIEANEKVWTNPSGRKEKVENFINETLERSAMVPEGIKAFLWQLREPKKEYILYDGRLLEYDKESIYHKQDSLHQDNWKGSNVQPNDLIDNADMSKVDKISSSKFNLNSDKLLNSQGLITENTPESHLNHLPNTENSHFNAGQLKLYPEEVFANRLQKEKDIGLTSNNKVSDVGALHSEEIKQKSYDKSIKKKQNLSEMAKERKVPASRIGRMISFGSLAAGLGIGTVAEVTRRSLGIKSENISSLLDNAFLTPANIDRIVDTLCKVRGAALKIGQLLSIQDNNVVSPVLQKAFERVRQSADFMPVSQVQKVLTSELGNEWSHKFKEFNKVPFAAASIGQVHLGKLLDGTEVAVKVQYPGVAKGIDSDIDNLMSVLKIWNIFPEGMYIDKLIEVAKRELAWEVDYEREAECAQRFKKLLQPYPEYYVPTVIDDLCTKRVFTSELIEGLPVDKCADMDIETRKHICYLIMELCLRELFQFRYMQTDPNWSNFFYNPESKKLILLDFGASRSYSKDFIDKYINVIKAASDGDRENVLLLSREMGFLTGYESKAMEGAHVDTIMILGEVFSEKAGEFDFGTQDTTLRVTKLVPTILNHRLCPPPEEIYSLHRKLSGVFLLCSKLKVKMNCRQMFLNVYNKYIFD